MSNVKHGFYSKNEYINPDMRIRVDLTVEELIIVERFLHGESGDDPILAHELTKIVYQFGRRRWSSLWPKAERYCTAENNIEYESLERLARTLK